MNAQLQQAIEVVRRDGDLPIAVLDVDLTLVENAPRTRAILRDYALSLQGTWGHAEEASELANSMPLVFSIVENLRSLGLESDEEIRGGVNFWRDTFFTDEYCLLDEPLPGAVEAVQTLHQAGCTVVYVTARTSSMLTGTISSFRTFGFPIGVTGTVLTLKESHAQTDKAFKAEALSWVSSLGTVVLCAENEPAYINLMHARFPDAFSLLVDTRHSPSAPDLETGVKRIESLQSFVLGDQQGGQHALDT